VKVVAVRQQRRVACERNHVSAGDMISSTGGTP
jgi:hypothetical protein